MPLYEFHCERCDKQFESFKSIASRDEPEPCPACGRPAERLISAVAMGGSGGRLASGPSCLPSGGG